MKYSYGWQKAHSAMTTLATSPVSLRERLAAAWGSLAILDHDLQGHVPSDQVAKFLDLHERMTRVSRMPEGSLAATTGDMTENDVLDVASRTFELCYNIIAAYHRDNGV